MPTDEPTWPGRQVNLHQDQTPPTDVPVFDCLVYVIRQADGSVRARLANLVGFEVTAASEGAAFAKLIPDLRRRLAEYLESPDPIPWLKEPAPLEPGEQRRFVPVHL